jgi:hypothetical protein
LNNTLRANGIGEFLQRLLAHIQARLVFATLQQIDRQLRKLTITRAIGIAGSDARRKCSWLTQQCAETPPETGSLGNHKCLLLV